MAYSRLEYSGCYYVAPDDDGRRDKQYLPQVNLQAHTTILSTTSRTTFTQTFVNPAKDVLKDVQYTFPLFDGVSVVEFQAKIGDRTIHGVVKEHKQAKEDYDEAVKAGRVAALLGQSPSASDTFTASIGNVPPLSEAVVHIAYLGELEHDAQADGVRLTLPSVIAPRYGAGPALTKSALPEEVARSVEHGKIDITVDVVMGKESKITTIQSPSHPLTVTLGRVSVNAEDVFEVNLASAGYTGKSGDIFFEKDFVVIVKATGQDTPFALLETHPTIPKQRTIVASLVPKFNIPSNTPEIVFVVDRSGSMYDKIDTLKSALRVFLKSLPVGVKFNICSFGSSYSFMWDRSRTYDADSLNEAMQYVGTISANFGGTEMYGPLNATVENRFKDMELEVLMLTDGQVWNQRTLFELVTSASADGQVRFFTLGIGNQASHSLIQGIARAGDGFAQSVGMNEQLDRKVVRMLKGALSPHIKDYTLEVEYDEADDEYEMIEKSNDIPAVTLPLRPRDEDKLDVDERSKEKPISLFSQDYKESEIPDSVEANVELPELSPPKIIQAPHKVPPVYSFSRTSIYLLLGPDTNPRTPKSVTLHGTSKYGPLQLTVPIEDVGKGTTIHQLAARKTTLELEEGRGWVYDAKDKYGKLVVEAHESKKEDFVKREAVRLGLKFQVGGKWCSFVAVEDNKDGEGQVTTIDVDNEREAGGRLFSSGAGHQTRHAMSAIPPCYGPPLVSGIMGRPSDPSGRMIFQEAGSASTLFAHQPQAQDHVNSSAFGGGHIATGGFRSSVRASARRMKQKMTPFGGQKRQAQFVAFEPPKDIGVESDRAVKLGGAVQEASDGHPAVNENKVHALIALQQFEGWWELTEDLLRIMGIKAVDVESLDWAAILGTASCANLRDELARKIVATLLVALYLDVKWPEEKETWELVHDKAVRWADAAVAQFGGDVSKRDLQPLRALIA